MEHKDKEALISMGYRELQAGIWAKPIGWMLFTYDDDTKIIANCFKGADDKMHSYDSKVYKTEPEQGLLGFIKLFEGYARTDVNVHQNSEYQFITAEQSGQLLMDSL